MPRSDDDTGIPPSAYTSSIASAADTRSRYTAESTRSGDSVASRDSACSLARASLAPWLQPPRPSRPACLCRMPGACLPLLRCESRCDARPAAATCSRSTSLTVTRSLSTFPHPEHAKSMLTTTLAS